MTSSPFREGDFVWCAFPERENPVRPGPLHLAYTLAVVAAAVGKFPGTTPEEMLAEITRHSRFTAAEFQALATDRPIDVRDLHRRIRGMIEQAERFIAGLPTDAIGVVFLDGDKPVQPDLAALGDYRRISGAPRGVWPSSPDISSAMLDRDNKPSPG